MFKTADWPWHSYARSRSPKIMLVMKLSIFFMLCLFLSARANVYAQTITVSGNNLPLQKIFAEVKKQTGYLVAGRADLMEELGTVSVSVKDMDLQAFLELIFNNKPVSFRLEKKTIVLSRKQQPGSAPLPEPVKLMVEAAPIAGLVYAEDGTPLNGVSVVVKRTKKGTVTDSKGSFSIAAETGDILSFTFVGYTSQEVKLTGTSVIVKLKVAHSVLDETQITAYGRTSRRLATGNIGTVKAEDIEKQPVFTVLEAIAGRVPGVIISPISGNPAAPVMVSIRGKNGINPNALSDPLYVIDGMPMSQQNSSSMTGNLPFSMGAVQSGTVNTVGENPLLSINPRDIESISILKDADATAIYGSRGANGVILITTKKAKAGPASFDFSISNGTEMLERFPKLMGTEEYFAVRREAFQNDGIKPNPTNAPDLLLWDPLKYTDWQRELVGTGSNTDVNVGVSGGTVQSKYRLSANYGSQKKIMNNGGKNIRGTFNSDFSHSSLNQKFRFGISNALAFTEVNSYPVVNPGDLPPNAPDIYDSNGDFNFEPYRIQNTTLFRFNELKRPSKSSTFSYRGIINFQYDILKGLAISANAGYMFTSNNNAFYMPQASNDPVLQPFSLANYGKSTSRKWQVEPQLRYNTYIGKGNLSVQLISNLQTEISSGEDIAAMGFANDAMMKSHNNAESTTFREGYKEYKYLSVSGIIGYTWDNKYVINLNARRDGSSRFGPGKQFGNFGSVGLAWIASEEKWIKAVLPSWFSFLKFRGSYGTTGSEPSFNYEYLSRWTKSSELDGFYNLFRYGGVDAFNVAIPLNQQFQWESTSKAEVGASVGFLQERIDFDFSYYQNKSGNQLTTLPIPAMTGFKNALTNWPAVVRNAGVEFSVRASLVQTKDWRLNLNFNVGRNWNKLISFPDLENSSYNGQLKVGHSTSTIYLFHYTGINPLTGAYSFEDRNKDGKITASYTAFPSGDIDDRYLTIESQPKYSGGMGFNLSYKGLSVSSQFTFVNKMRQDPYLSSVPGKMGNMPLPDEIKNNHWKQPGDQAKYPRYTTNPFDLGPIYSSDGGWVNGSYVRWQNLSVSWQLPGDWIKKMRIRNASLSVSTANLLTLSPYKGLDPEMTISRFTTPTARIIATRLSLTF